MSLLFTLISDVRLVLPAPVTQFVRYRQSFPRKLRPPHFTAKLIATVVKPQFPSKFDKFFPQHLKCRKPLSLTAHQVHVRFTKLLDLYYILLLYHIITFSLFQEENPYETILAKEIKDVVLKSKMLLILHRNPATNHEVHTV